MSDKVFYVLSGLVAVGLIALALVWPPRSATGLDETRAPAPAAPPAAEAEHAPEAAAETAPVEEAEPVEESALAAEEPAGE